LQAANQVLLLFGPIENPRWPPAGTYFNITIGNMRTLQGTSLPSMVPIHPVVLEKKFVLHISNSYVKICPRWWPSWIGGSLSFLTIFTFAVPELLDLI
jgi:hypothetical protein